MLTENDFYKQQQSAVERMREINSRSAFKPPTPKPSQNPQQNQPPPKTQNNSVLSSFNIPFLDSLSSDGDIALILGLLLILMSEKTDKTLLFALVYILI